MIGRRVSHFRILEKLGEGGMGQVYLARDERLDRTVALKILPPEFAADPDRRRRFEQEAKAASALNHANIAHIYDVGDVDGTCFIAMEHVSGESLQQHLTAGGLPSGEIVDLGGQIAEALAAAHACGITHRDIKPGNIMVTPEGQAKVLDFGLAKRTPATAQSPADLTTQNVTRAGVVMGTVQYMSPEQALGKTVDARSDIFSMGVVFYQMATGRLPFKGDTTTQTIDRIIHAQPDPVPDREGVEPAALDRIIRKCLEKDPDNRYQSAKEVRVDLRNMQRDSQSQETVVVALPAAASRKGLYAAVAGLVIVVASVAVGFQFLPPAEGAIRSIAVLPFENGTGDPETDYLCEGLAETLINNLSQIPNLRVISRSSSFAFKDKRSDTQLIGRELNVQAVLVGRMVQRQDQLIISAELVDVKDNHQLWGGRYNRNIADVLAIEEDLTTTITEKLRLKLTGEQKAQLVQRQAQDPDAYRLYLKGRQFAIGTEEQMRKAVEFFQQALEHQPDYALVHAALADVYLNQAFHGTREGGEALEKARASVAKALEIDPDLGEAHALAGELKYVFEWDWEGANADFRRALDLSPGSTDVHLRYAEYLCILGRVDEAIAISIKAKELDPHSARSAHWLAFNLMMAGDLDGAIREFKGALELHPSWTWGHIKLSKAFAEKGMTTEALAEAEKAESELRSGGETPLSRAWLGYVYAKSGATEKARAALKALDDMSVVRRVDPIVYLAVHAGLGDKESLLGSLEEAYAEHSLDMIWLRLIPRIYWSGLESEPRYQQLVAKMNYPPE